MEYLLKAVILGIIQGLTEFLPVSSSGHLVLFASFLEFEDSGIAFEVFVHFGTLVSVLIAFRKELTHMITAPFEVWINKSTDKEIKEFLNWDFYIIVATIPESAKEKPRMAKVIAVGTDEDLQELVKAGDTIIYSKYSGDELKMDDKEYIIVQRGDILAIVK